MSPPRPKQTSTRTKILPVPSGPPPSSTHLEAFRLEIRTRGPMGSAQYASCEGLEQAVRFGQANFPAFAERNPWIAQDSRRRKIWILLDPETESTR
jgi:hypothetical protein